MGESNLLLQKYYVAEAKLVGLEQACADAALIDDAIEDVEKARHAIREHLASTWVSAQAESATPA